MLSKKLKEIFQNKDTCFDDAKTVAKENGKKLTLDLSNMPSQRRSCLIRVDDCLIKHQDIEMKKCDFWFHVSENDNNKIEDNYNIFVEFKGGHIDTAYQQITNTIKWIKPQIGLTQSNCYAAIVASRACAPLRCRCATILPCSCRRVCRAWR